METSQLAECLHFMLFIEIFFHYHNDDDDDDSVILVPVCVSHAVPLHSSHRVKHQCLLVYLLKNAEGCLLTAVLEVFTESSRTLH